ncbi:MAG TPA: heme exporter protein CcmB [Bacteroidia bacterium]|jgi:heme exporter protein B|nr:heme exporter protein CcmB [Bacteroidia bacterium]HRG51554.1 heme exporter protein CcmB [Bacteroidia bacterium]
MLAKHINYLIAKEIKLELRNKYALGGILLYVISTIFVSYLCFKQIVTPATWNALFWIILLFASLNAVAKSFITETKGKLLYIYSLVSPQAVIISKIIYNSLLLLVLSGLCLVVYCLFIGNKIQDMPLFLLTLTMGSFGFSSLLTMVSAIASKSGNNFTLMAILSFPIILPLLMVLIKLSKNALDGLEKWDVQYLLILLCINMIIIALSYLLFRYLWRD